MNTFSVYSLLHRRDNFTRVLVEVQETDELGRQIGNLVEIAVPLDDSEASILEGIAQRALDAQKTVISSAKLDVADGKSAGELKAALIDVVDAP